MRRAVSAVYWLAFASFGFMEAHAEPSIDLKTPKVTSLSTRAEHVLTEMKEACATLHLKFVGPLEFLPTWGCLDADYGIVMMTGTQVRLDSKAFSFSFREADGRLTSFQNTLTEKLPENQIYYDTPDKPTWTQAHAIEIATVFEKIFVEPKDCILGAPNAEYVHTIGGRRGAWMICWPRVDSKGHLFYGDHVTIQIQEGFAPFGAGIYLTTSYVEGTSEPITLNSAISKARQAIATKEVDRGFESYADGDTLIGNKFDRSELIVVLPPKDLKVLGGPSTGVARLAWEIWFDPRHSKSAKHPIYDDSYAIWVDAHNGKILGTDGWL